MPTDPRVEVITELRKQTALLTRIAVGVEMLIGARASVAPAASDRDLDGPHGDPIVKGKPPRDWAGESMEGRTFSACDPAFLDLLAYRFDYFASQPDKADKKRLNERDAARCRGWAARLRAGWTPAPVTAPINEAQTEPSW